MSVIRPLAPEDITQLAGLLDEYLEETYRRRFVASLEALHRDLFGREAHTLVAVDDAELVGFSVWQRAYDVHHAIPGGELLDLFVQKSYRGGVLAPQLLLATVAQVQSAGGLFLRGQAASGPAEKLYERVAVTSAGTEFILGGRAFRELAGLHGRPVREALALVPPRSANHEP